MTQKNRCIRFTFILHIYFKLYEGGIIDEKEFNDKLATVAELAVGDACTGSNPRSINPEQMAKLLTCCFYDTEVDF